MKKWRQEFDGITNKAFAVIIAWAVFACIIHIIIVFQFHIQPTSPYNISDPSTVPNSLEGWVEAVINIPIAV